MTTDLAEALSVALEATELARRVLLAECARPEGPRGEIGHCPADDEAEWLIRNHVRAAFPRWAYLGEETGAQPGAEDCTWYVDPNDGTTSMQRGYRGHAVSIGLVRAGVPVLGVVCAVDAPDDRGDLIAWAEGCGPLRRDGATVSPRTWAPSLAAEDVVGLSQGANRNPVGNLACVAPARFIGMPSVAYRLALVAVGDYAATVSLNYLSAWDFAAGHALLRAVGGLVADENGREITYADSQAGSRVFAGSPLVVERLVQRSWQGVSRSGFGAAAPPPDLAPARAQPGKLVHDVDVLSRAQGCLLGQIAADNRCDPRQLMPGQPSGASERALVLGRSIVARGGMEQDAIAAAYAEAARFSPESNSVLGRASILGIWGAFRPADEVATAARADAQLTHPDRVCRDASALVAVALAAAIREKLDAWRTSRFALEWSRRTGVDNSLIDALDRAERDPAPAPSSQPTFDVRLELQDAFSRLLHAPTLEQALSQPMAHAAAYGALFGAVYGRDAIPRHWRDMVLSCRPMPGLPGVAHPRPATFWPTDALVLAERLLLV